MTSAGHHGSLMQRQQQQQMSSSFKASSFDPNSKNTKNVREAAAGSIRENISIKLDEAVGSATISPSGRDVCLAARKGLFILDLDDAWATPRFLPHYSDIVADVQWSPHSTRAHWVVSTSGPKALVWNLAATPASGASAIEHICLGHERSITDINWAVFQYDTLATCGIDGNVLCYDLRLGGRRPTIRYSGWRYGATQVKYNRQSANLLASSHGEYVYIWDDRKGSSPVTTIQAHKQKIYGIDWSRKTRDDIVTCSLDSTVKLWHLDGAQQAEAPTQIINTASPVWRARFTPFGNGIVTLPQRSSHSVSLWSPSSPEAPIETLCSTHTDVVREFLWRSRGGNDIRDDDREFQLVTWGSDKQLLMTPVPHSITSLVGHVPHSPIEVRQTRRNAENRSFRDPSFQPSPSSNLSISLGNSQSGGKSVSPTDKAAGSSFGFNSTSSPVEHKMTPPSALTARVPLSTATASRYGRSSHSNTTTGSASSTGSPSFGTSPAAPPSPYLHSDHAPSRRKGISVVKSSANLSQMNRATARPSVSGTRKATGLAQSNQAFMTRAATGRGRAGGHDTVSWMENVRIVSGQNAEEKDEPPHGTDAASTVGDRDSVPLHEEITSVARAFESRVRFEKINIPSRTVVVALHGPWAVSGLSVFLRATFHFPSDYPQVTLSIDIERSSSIGDKGRARILSNVRGLAGRYANKRCNSMEAVLICLTTSKLQEPVTSDDIEGHTHEEIPNSSLADGEMMGNLDLDEEYEDVDDERDLERFLANRNCPPPRRCGAVFGPTGQLFTFFPMDPLHHHAATVEKRQRSRSSSRDRKQRNQRRRLFESFGVIPSLQARKAPESGYEEAIEDDQEEDSDEILNMPSLLAQRRRSRGRTDSVGTSQHPKLAGTGRAFNSRIYGQDCSSIIGIDLSHSATYKLQGSLSKIIKVNARLSHIDNEIPTSWLIRRAWETLSRLLQTVKSKDADGHRPLFLGDRLPEQAIIDLLEIFNCLGDVQMLGILACLIELDRRILRSSKPLSPRRFSRSPAQSIGTDYFSMKPPRPNRSSSENLPRHSVTTPSAPGAPFKSPKDWLMSSSYGTQASSGGSSTRGSSWANNLSTFFKSATGDRSSGGRSTPPPEEGAKPASTSSLSPAFIKRAAIEPLKEIRKAGGIASARPANNRGPSHSKLRGTPHVSFAATAAEQRAPSPALSITTKAIASKTFKVVIKHVTSPDSLAYPSILLEPPMQAQLEYYRLIYAELLHRIDLPQQRAQVLQLMRASVDGHFKPFMLTLSGMDRPKEMHMSLEPACTTCGDLLTTKKESTSYCGTCKQRQRPLPCSICHFPLDGLVETCLACLHSGHLACLLEWRQDEVCCPAACGCECTNVQENASTPFDVLASFKSPLLFT